jgi:hypothetical protein
MKMRDLEGGHCGSTTVDMMVLRIVEMRGGGHRDTISIFQAKDPNMQARLRNSYLGVWAAYEPIERLLEAWKLAKPLCALHQAVSYRHIIATLEDTSKPELAPQLPYWLRTLLQSLE